MKNKRTPVIDSKTVSDWISDHLLSKPQAITPVSSEMRTQMVDMLEWVSDAPEQSETFSLPPPTCIPISSTVSTSSLLVSSLLPTLITLANRILEELEMDLSRLLCLNPSRRIAIAQYLEQLAGSTPLHHQKNDPVPQLRPWLEGTRTTAQNLALKTYFEEIATLALGQALLLKSWSDRGIRTWSLSDLGRLNWALSSTLKPLVPMDREGWQITRPNLYSWFNPGVQLQKDIWSALKNWDLTQEGPHFLVQVLQSIKKTQSDFSDPTGYDLRFLKLLWDHLPLLGFDIQCDSILKRNKIVFSPTLRNGAMVRISSPQLQWMGLETSAYQLMQAELMYIWWKPMPPPAWTVGTGLEVPPKDQLPLALCSQKPSVLSQITEMQAFDASFVFEEQILRLQSRHLKSQRIREQIETSPFLKRLRCATTSLGALQACVAISKLRPAGLLIWARQEPLSPKEGMEVLHFLLNRAQFICEWDFSALEHTLPITALPYPQHLYLFKKEPQLEKRLSHRPMRYTLHGAMRSHIELSSLIEDAFNSIQGTQQPRGQWEIRAHWSPAPQKDWLEKWPDPTAHQTILQLDTLRLASLSLAHFTTIRSTPIQENHTWSVGPGLKGLWVSASYDSGNRKFIAAPLPPPGQEVTGAGFLILVPNDDWVAPLCYYLMSSGVHQWLEHYVERRADRWLLNEQFIKWIPVPRTLLIALGVPLALEEQTNATRELILPTIWGKKLLEILHSPQTLRQELQELPSEDPLTVKIHAHFFAETARALDNLRFGQKRLFSLVTARGEIRWRELLEVLPPGQCITLSVHPQIRLTGSLPPHLPIGKIDRLLHPQPSILLETESGFRLQIHSERESLIHMIWEQLQGLHHPTWHELLQYLKVPHQIQLAESTANDILRSHAEQTILLENLQALLDQCRLI